MASKWVDQLLDPRFLTLSIQQGQQYGIVSIANRSRLRIGFSTNHQTHIVTSWLEGNKVLEVCSIRYLPPVEREVASLLIYHRWTQDEVAELFQVSVRSIRQRWKWALRKVQAGDREG
jgi:hypothetical protein